MMGDSKTQIESLREQIQNELETKAKGSESDWWKANGANNSLEPARSIRVRRVLKGHFGKVYSMHWGGDSKQLVSASQDGKLIVWNGVTTNKIQAIHLRSSWVMTCAYEQTENNLVACGGLDNICSVYRLGSEPGLSTTRAHRELAQHEGYLSCCRFNGPNQIFTSSGDGTCIQWDVETGSCTNTYGDHGADVMSVAVSKKDPFMFASGSTDALAKLWDTRTGKCVLTFPGHESDINSVAFFPDGNALGTGSDDSSCKLFDIRACREVNSYGVDSIVCGVTSVDFSVSGRILFAGYDDFSCYGWDVTSRDRPIKNSVHENRTSCLQVNPEGSALCTGSWDTLLKISA
uniref:Guanine nucleotide-binding protein subunit beta n=1 Tax=Mucochytrium quahogii TaxID=96639 RepID=A0A7S2WC44_9STRA|mmetsp:Transcript_8879/g.14426  ORF Transcript_8879/g.14426 Transcript_8879/m.14426 type:complete len:347 (+) Transcript_8879:123-1163(+)|eukprot:CAMPEP_0203763552 /NCGR_PEP_ID=MMETSP0098-20131031/16380_1 /ASSEMBLY_ACC=CAM_ASM_000208 /TAXON_ID=96639 /ORGANISM=" , Strain NY0313808BC1" /LENGTH=346 /DNA_ID=CAMNT_0050658491 /DNA_START=168 /DNA_END=1208 /DNA_ORIENTATION=-